MLLGVDPFAELKVVDYGDAETVSGDTAQSHAAVKQLVAEICAAGAIPVILGGDHSVAIPDMSAVAEHHGPGTVGVIHFDAHADTASALHGFELSHGSPMRVVVDNGAIRVTSSSRSGCAVGGPRTRSSRWMRAERLSLVHDVRARRARLSFPAWTR